MRRPVPTLEGRSPRGGAVRTLAAALAIGALVGGCATPLDPSPWMPLGGGDPSAFEGLSRTEIEQLGRVSTDLVAALVQLPETSPTNVTLQYSPPRSAFGNTVIRALEDAGYGLQRVPADQGAHYVAYSQRFSETEAGPVTDYELRVGDVTLQRAYSHGPTRVFPSSLLAVEGSAARPDDITLDDALFREQGGDGDAFISGVRAGDELPSSVGEVTVDDFDARPTERRTSAREVLASARTRGTLVAAEREIELDGRERLRRTVLIFDDAETRLMGEANKQAVRLLARDARAGDLFVVTACTDADGRDAASRVRGARVVEEFVGHGVPSEAVRLGPCIRASFRHASDDSPVPVEVVQYRMRGGE